VALSFENHYLSVVAPVFNRAHLLSEFHDKLESAIRLRWRQWEVVYVDDGSHDASWSNINQLAKSRSNVRGVRLSRNFGQHPAVFAGLARIRGDFVLITDVDADLNPTSIPLLFDAMCSGAEMAVACESNKASLRFPHRTVASAAIHSLLSRTGSGPKAPKGFRPTSLRVLGPACVQALHQYSERGAILGPLSLQLGFKVEMVPITASIDTPISRTSGYSLTDRLVLSFQIWLRYSKQIPRIPVFAGFIFALLSIVLLIVLGLTFLITGGNPISIIGWLTVVQVLAIGVSLTISGIILAIAMEIFREVLDRPRYHIAESVN